MSTAPGRHRQSTAARADAASREQSLYATREKVYPRQVHGWFATLRVSAAVVLLGAFYGVAWIRWDSQQVLLFDLPARQFHVFGVTFFPQDFLYLTLVLIAAALSLFFFTALAGRLWCGYACPQTVWTEVFLWIERQIEGDRGRQMKLDRAPWSGRKLGIKATKHAVWIAFSLWTGFTFVGYFTPILDLGERALSATLGPWETFWILFYGLATYGNAGWLREQVCIYMCPYARFQSAMFDADTLVISYDRDRGEPRGSRRRGVESATRGLGDCIDCTLCVQVCPTGIDIRQGLQYQCIACAACVDVCDQVMSKMGYRPGLIRYTTEHAVQGRPSRVLRPRVVVYAGLLLATIAATLVSLALRNPLALDVIRDRNALYRETAEGMVENVYTLKLINMDDASHRFDLSIEGAPGLALVSQSRDHTVPGGEVVSIAARVRADPYHLAKRSTAFEFRIRASDDPDLSASEEARFVGPVPAQTR